MEECEQTKEENSVLQDELDRLSRGGTELDMVVEQKRTAEDEARSVQASSEIATTSSRRKLTPPPPSIHADECENS